MPRLKESPKPKDELRAFFFPGAGEAGITVQAVDQEEADQKLQQLLKGQS